MAAYIIVNVRTTDPERYEQYKAHAQETVAAYGGRYLARGGRFKVLEGVWEPTRVVVCEFPSYERAVEWWESDAYAPAKELRQSISDTDMIVVEGV